MRSARSEYLGLAVLGAYAAARHLIYAAVPLDPANQWGLREFAMTVPRLLGLAACLWILRRESGWSERALRFRATPLAVCLLAGVVLHVWSGCVTLAGLPPPRLLPEGWLLALPVGLFEEALFRGVIYGGLRGRMSALRAALLSSAAFAVFHVEAQPVEAWPGIFVSGLGLCAALEAGATLPWLAAAHWVGDAALAHLFVRGYASNVLVEEPVKWLLVTVSLALLRPAGPRGRAPALTGAVLAGLAIFALRHPGDLGRARRAAELRRALGSDASWAKAAAALQADPAWSEVDFARDSRVCGYLERERGAYTRKTFRDLTPTVYVTVGDAVPGPADPSVAELAASCPQFTVLYGPSGWSSRVALAGSVADSAVGPVGLTP